MLNISKSFTAIIGFYLDIGSSTEQHNIVWCCLNVLDNVKMFIEKKKTKKTFFFFTNLLDVIFLNYKWSTIQKTVQQTYINYRAETMATTNTP